MYVCCGHPRSVRATRLLSGKGGRSFNCRWRAQRFLRNEIADCHLKLFFTGKTRRKQNIGRRIKWRSCVWTLDEVLLAHWREKVSHSVWLRSHDSRAGIRSNSRSSTFQQLEAELLAGGSVTQHSEHRTWAQHPAACLSFSPQGPKVFSKPVSVHSHNCLLIWTQRSRPLCRFSQLSAFKVVIFKLEST